MKKLLFSWWVNKKQPKKTENLPSCGCVGNKQYNCDVFFPHKDEPVFMKLCIHHIEEKCLDGCFVSL